MVVWRFHDFSHRKNPDLIQTGVLRALGWSAYQDKDASWIVRTPETTLSALAADIPTICFWNPAHWGMDEASREMFALFSKTGILYPTASQAAARSTAIWPRVEEWWQSRAVRAAREIWLQRYALNTVPSTGKQTGAWSVFRYWHNRVKSC